MTINMARRALHRKTIGTLVKAHSPYGGRHELGQNHLIHEPTIRTIVDLVRSTEGDVLEIGAGGGALTLQLAGLGRNLLAVDIDPQAVERLQQRLQERLHHRPQHQPQRGPQRTLPAVVVHADALTVPYNRPVIVGNIPYHLTTPILRRLLTSTDWRDAVLLTQWEVARKRAGVGGGTMLTAQTAPWFEFELQGRVPASGFRPRPGVDGGVLTIRRRPVPLVNAGERARYERFVKRVFTAPGNGMGSILAGVLRAPRDARPALAAARILPARLPRDVTPAQWARLWQEVRDRTR